MITYDGIDAEYPFEIPDILCPEIQKIAELLGLNLKDMKAYDDAGYFPTKSRTGAYHSPYWTEDEAKEVYIKGKILMIEGTV